MSAPQIELFTAADYRAMPEDGRRYQLVEGELVFTPTPDTFHQLVMGNLICMVDTYVQANKAGTLLPRVDVYLDDHNVYQPDILYVSRTHADRTKEDGVYGAPDLVIEILSPSTAGLDRRKRGHFAQAGTVEFWQVDTGLRQIQRFVFAENTAKPIALIDEPETFSSALFPELTLATTDIFRR